MILGLCLLAALQSVEPTLALRLNPAKVAIGQPVQVVLSVRHDPFDAPALAGEPLAERLDASWVVTEGPRQRSLPGDGFVRTEFVWTVLSLEGGPREFPAPEVQLSTGASLSAAPADLYVAAALEQGEDAPRPLPDFHDIEPRPALSLEPVVVAPLAAGLLAIGALVFLMRRRQLEGEREPSAIERYLDLAARRSSTGGPAELRDLVRELTRLVRGAVDERAGLDRAGLADDEWLAALDGHALGADARSELAEVLRRAERVKYAGEAPTRFAIDELFNGARGVLEAIAPAETDDLGEPRGDAA